MKTQIQLNLVAILIVTGSAIDQEGRTKSSWAMSQLGNVAVG